MDYSISAASWLRIITTTRESFTCSTVKDLGLRDFTECRRAAWLSYNSDNRSSAHLGVMISWRIVVGQRKGCRCSQILFALGGLCIVSLLTVVWTLEHTQLHSHPNPHSRPISTRWHTHRVIYWYLGDFVRKTCSISLVKVFSLDGMISWCALYTISKCHI